MLYRIGTATFTQGSNVVTGLNTLWKTHVKRPVVGDMISVNKKDWYEITAINSDSEIEIDENFVEASTGGFVAYVVLPVASATTNTRVSTQVGEVLEKLGNRVTVSSVAPTAQDGNDGDIWIVPSQ